MVNFLTKRSSEQDLRLLLKYVINIHIELVHDFQPQTRNQIFHMAWHVILCSIYYIDAPNKGIEQACS